MGFTLPLIRAPDIGADGSEALDDVGDVDTDADEIQDQRGAIEEEVGLGRTEELDEEATEADSDDDVEETVDQRRGLVHELEMGFEVIEEVFRNGVAGPEEGEVVGERREEDAQEEASRWNHD